MKTVRNIAFGYSTICNIRCRHCVAAGETPAKSRMDLEQAVNFIHDMAACNVTGISFTSGEPLLFLDDISVLVKACKDLGIYSRVVTNGFWANTVENADNIVSLLVSSGLSQLRISCSRWHQEHVNIANIINAAQSCINNRLDYFISFITDFSEKDDSIEKLLQDSKIIYFPEPVIYLGRAEGFERKDLKTDYFPNTCAMNPYLTPDLDVYACCDGAGAFPETVFYTLETLKAKALDPFL